VDLPGDLRLWFYELLAHESEFDEAEFLELVLESRARVIDDFTQDTLSEAIGADLAVRHGFTIVDDSVLRAAVNVSSEEGETFIAEVGGEAPVEGEIEGEMRTMLVDIDREDRRWGDA
jgi:hypothetical protein